MDNLDKKFQSSLKQQVDSLLDATNLSTGVGNYHLSQPRIQCSCSSRPKDTKGLAPLIDVDSKLMGLSHKLNKCSTVIEKIQGNNDKINGISSQDLCGNLPSISTRIEDPAGNLKGVSIPRFEFLPRNPQYKLEFPEEQNVPTRLQSKEIWLRLNPNHCY